MYKIYIYGTYLSLATKAPQKAPFLHLEGLWTSERWNMLADRESEMYFFFSSSYLKIKAGGLICHFYDIFHAGGSKK